jgi:hypothetical protein
VTSKVDLLVILHNSKPFLPAFFRSLKTISTPVTAYFLDNNSQDESANVAVESISDLPFTAFVTRAFPTFLSPHSSHDPCGTPALPAA